MAILKSALTSPTTNHVPEALNKHQDSPSLRQSQLETHTLRSSRFIQRVLEFSVTKSANDRGVDVGVLARCRKMTERQGLNDNLLQDR